MSFYHSLKTRHFFEQKIRLLKINIVPIIELNKNKIMTYKYTHVKKKKKTNIHITLLLQSQFKKKFFLKNRLIKSKYKEYS